MKTRKTKKGILAATLAAGMLCASVCSFALTDFSGGDIKQSDAYTTGAAPTANDIGDITLANYETRTDGLVFDGNKLAQLFGKLVQGTTGTPTSTADLAAAKLQVSGSTSTVTSTASTGNDLTQTNSLDFKTMQAKLGSPITLSLG